MSSNTILIKKITLSTPSAVNPPSPIKIKFDDIEDVSATGAIQNQILIFDSNSQTWMLGTNSQTVSALDAIGDVSVAGSTNGQVLMKSGSQWISADVSFTLQDLTNVDSTMVPTNGQVLKWDSASSRWKAKNDSAGAGSVSLDLNGLTDVIINVGTLTNKQVLKYNGSGWVNAVDSDTKTALGISFDNSGTNLLAGQSTVQSSLFTLDSVLQLSLNAFAGHTHTISQVVGLQAQLDALADSSYVQSQLNLKSSITQLNTKADSASVVTRLDLKSNIGHQHKLDSLNNVSINTGTLTNNQVLKYSAGAWRNAADSVGGAGGPISGLSDVQDGMTPAAGEVLKWSGTQWIADSVTAGVALPYAHKLDSHSNVLISNPTPNQVLKYNGSAWVNAADSVGAGGGTLGSLTDVQDVLAPTLDQVLRWVGTEWQADSVTIARVVGLQTQLNALADSAYVQTQLNLKSSIVQLGFKADSATVVSRLSLKADSATVVAGLNTKASITQLNTKSDSAGVITKLNLKANIGHQHALDSATNVVIISPSNNQVLKFRSSDSKWINATDSGANVLNSVSDAGGLGSLVNNAGVVTYTGPGIDSVRQQVSGSQGVVYNTTTGVFTSDSTTVRRFFKVQTDSIGEKTLNAGVTVEGVLIKDGFLPWTNISGRPADSVPFSFRKLDSLSDVVIVNPINNQVLKYNGSQWINAADSLGGGAGSIQTLSDVENMSPAFREVLTWNGSQWFADSVTISAGSVAFVNVQNAPESNILLDSALKKKSSIFHNHKLDSLNDVVITNPTNKQVLKYDSAAGLWRNQADSGSGGGTLGGLTDVENALNPTLDQVLRWAGTEWQADSVTIARVFGLQSQLDALADSAYVQTQLNLKASTTQLNQKADSAGVITKLNLKSNLGHLHPIDSLNDVTITSPKNDQSLRFSSGQWINDSVTMARVVGLTSSLALKADSAGVITKLNLKANLGHQHLLDSLNDVVITSPTPNQVLKYNGSQWINAADSLGGAGGTLTDLTDVTISGPTTKQVLRFNGSEWRNAIESAQDIAFVPVGSISATNVWTAVKELDSDTYKKSDLSANIATLQVAPNITISPFSKTFLAAEDSVTRYRDLGYSKSWIQSVAQNNKILLVFSGQSNVGGVPGIDVDPLNDSYIPNPMVKTWSAAVPIRPGFDYFEYPIDSINTFSWKIAHTSDSANYCKGLGGYVGPLTTRRGRNAAIEAADYINKTTGLEVYVFIQYNPGTPIRYWDSAPAASNVQLLTHLRKSLEDPALVAAGITKAHAIMWDQGDADRVNMSGRQYAKQWYKMRCMWESDGWSDRYSTQICLMEGPNQYDTRMTDPGVYKHRLNNVVQNSAWSGQKYILENSGPHMSWISSRDIFMDSSPSIYAPIIHYGSRGQKQRGLTSALAIINGPVPRDTAVPDANSLNWWHGTISNVVDDSTTIIGSLFNIDGAGYSGGKAGAEYERRAGFGFVTKDIFDKVDAFNLFERDSDFGTRDSTAYIRIGGLGTRFITRMRSDLDDSLNTAFSIRSKARNANLLTIGTLDSTFVTVHHSFGNTPKSLVEFTTGIITPYYSNTLFGTMGNFFFGNNNVFAGNVVFSKKITTYDSVNIFVVNSKTYTSSEVATYADSAMFVFKPAAGNTTNFTETSSKKVFSILKDNDNSTPVLNILSSFIGSASYRTTLAGQTGTFSSIRIRPSSGFDSSSGLDVGSISGYIYLNNAQQLKTSAYDAATSYGIAIGNPWADSSVRVGATIGSVQNWSKKGSSLLSVVNGIIYGPISNVQNNDAIVKFKVAWNGVPAFNARKTFADSIGKPDLGLTTFGAGFTTPVGDSNTSRVVYDRSKFTGNTTAAGGKAYTIPDIVRALKNYGLLDS